ncbi:hypothetical protein FNF29_07071 [Cafeteria roenbergensis]|uniref:3'-5' exonuclease n=1 Tax=Cafeteria roenbergensis TaxID=33653 RepID=A0A5A8C4Q8_CAFRO|nr:hypothetical protein FNF29_07071 [Cafeteria roenbergensis]|eukprot:KAA0147858.1 hypothetical protein FNF29_07071 [Cafeteria roenbergensis]
MESSTASGAAAPKAGKRSASAEPNDAISSGSIRVPVPGAGNDFDVIVTLATTEEEVDAWMARRVAGAGSLELSRIDWAGAAWSVPPVAHPQPELFGGHATPVAPSSAAAAGSAGSSALSSAAAGSSSFWRDGDAASDPPAAAAAAAAASSASKAPDAKHASAPQAALDSPAPAGARLARDCAGGARPAVVGLDCEWRPTFRAGAAQRPVALLQLSWGRCVLLVPLLRLRAFPASLRALLESPDVLKTGVGVEGDARKLGKDYGVVCRGVLDVAECHIVATRASETPADIATADAALRASGKSPPTAEQLAKATGQLLGAAFAPGTRARAFVGLLAQEGVGRAAARFVAMGRKYQAMSLRAMTRAYCGAESWKSKSTTMSNWEAFPLRRRQIEYAALDAWAGAAIADGLFCRAVLDSELARALSTEMPVEGWSGAAATVQAADAAEQAVERQKQAAQGGDPPSRGKRQRSESSASAPAAEGPARPAAASEPAAQAASKARKGTPQRDAKRSRRQPAVSPRPAGGKAAAPKRGKERTSSRRPGQTASSNDARRKALARAEEMLATAL